MNLNLITTIRDAVIAPIKAAQAEAINEIEVTKTEAFNGIEKVAMKERASIVAPKINQESINEAAEKAVMEAIDKVLEGVVEEMQVNDDAPIVQGKK